MLQVHVLIDIDHQPDLHELMQRVLRDIQASAGTEKHNPAGILQPPGNLLQHFDIDLEKCPAQYRHLTVEHLAADLGHVIFPLKVRIKLLIS